MTNLDASHIHPIGSVGSTTEAYIRQKVLPATCAEPETSSAPEMASFAGRWLVVTELGDCIVDHVVGGCSEGIRKVHLKTVCALVASVFQFVIDIGNQTQTTGTMHALALSTFKILVFRLPGFSIAAVISKSANLETAVQYKAQEIAIAMRERIGEALTKVVGQLQSSNDAKMHSFTLESMLDKDEEQDKILLDPVSQGVAESVFQEKLSKSYGDLLRGVIGEPQGPGFRNVSQACVCDDCGRLLILLTHQDKYVVEHHKWDHGSKWLYSTAQKLCSLPSCNPAEDTILSAPSNYETHDVLTKVNGDSSGLLSLWFWEGEESGTTTPIVVGVAGPLRICIQLWKSETELLPTAGNPIVASSLLLKISLLESEEQPDVCLKLLGDLNTAMHSLSIALGIKRQKPTRFMQHASDPIPE